MTDNKYVTVTLPAVCCPTAITVLLADLQSGYYADFPDVEDNLTTIIDCIARDYDNRAFLKMIT